MKIISGPRKWKEGQEYVLQDGEDPSILRWVRMHEGEILTCKAPKKKEIRLVPGGRLYRRIKAVCAGETA